MRSLALALLLALAPASAFAASYMDLDGFLIDPIRDTSGGIHPYNGPNLEPSANLSFADLPEARLPLANLSDADLSDADLRDADLTGAFMVNTNFAGANLTGAELTDAILIVADLTDADLFEATLIDANLQSADLSSADLTAADLTDADLMGTIYDEFTFFPSGLTIDSGDWGLPSGAAPWELGMVPAPEPASGLMLGAGVIALVGMASQQRPKRRAV
jgi:hypothetical protein